MNKIINIIFLGGAKRVSFAKYLIENGKAKNVEVFIYSYELTREVPIASVGKVIIGKKWNSSVLMENLLKVIEEKKINVVLPFVDPAIEVASKLKELKPDLFIPSSHIDICYIMFDKQLSNQWFEKNNIPIPKRYSAKELYNGEVTFPIILKPRNGSASKGIIILRDASSLINIDNIENYLIQEFFEESKEYTVDCYVSKKSEIIMIIPRIRLDMAGGEVMNSKTVRDKELIDLSRKTLVSGGFCGPVTIQFIENCVTNKRYIMEINPRLGGGVITSIAAGGDVSSLILEEALNNEIYPINNWKENVLMTRYFKEVIFYADNN